MAGAWRYWTSDPDYPHNRDDDRGAGYYRKYGDRYIYAGRKTGVLSRIGLMVRPKE